MASQKRAKKTRADVRKAVTGGGSPWLTIAAVVAVLALASTVFGYAYVRYADKTARDAALAEWTPSESNRDPSLKIQGVATRDVGKGGNHVKPTQRVNYDSSPAFGGAHDGVWAACTGVVYDSPVRTENLVHSLEHGAVWISYNPDKLDDAGRQALRQKVDGQQYMALSPYPNLDTPISLQSWGHQLKLDNPNDPRIDQFIRSLRQNQYTHPEVGASCEAMGPGQFDPSSPPPFDPTPPGPDAVPMALGATAQRPGPIGGM
jgi:hypothetical protein